MENLRNATIVAIATPLGVGGVGIVRISGEKSLEIAKGIYSPFPKDLEVRKMYLGKIDVADFADKGFFVYFKAPNSYTGEDVVEFQVHGSPVVLQNLVDKAISLGAEMANPGEFSERAFMNGKMSLDEAESLIDLINSKSTAEAKATENLLSGSLKRKILQVQDNLSEMLAKIDVSFDYPEHDDETQIGFDVKQDLQKVQIELQKLLESHKTGKVLANGINVCIVGKPNVGKSSLLNALLGTNSAIVTEIAGTTTDVIKDTYIFNGVRFNMIDTAGIRQGKSLIENLGIEKSKQQLELADLILFVLDASKPFDDEDRAVFELVKDRKMLVVLNKTDLQKQCGSPLKIDAEISTQNDDDIEKLKKTIFDLTVEQNIGENDIVLVNARHANLLQQAIDLVASATTNIENVSLDCIAVDLQSAWNVLGQIVGNSDIERIIDKIFSKFCLGK